ncbi:MAG TPA: histidine kinase N-terminal 7TM domain-containing protein [Draconibacterium sp.]|nr:histidine kinase N-terminal 7TM domain-containing protein [Draconibacterium sp.]
MFQILTINSIIQLITAFAAISTIILLWKFREAIAVRFLIYLEVFVSIWAIAYALEFSTPHLHEKIFYSQLSYLGIAFIPVCYFFFTTTFSQKYHLVNKRNIFLTTVIPIVTLVLVFTNESHKLVWEELSLNSATNILHYVHGLWFWIFYIYTFSLIGAGIFNLISSFSNFTSYYKKQIRILLIGSLIPVFANLIYVFDLNPIPGFDWTTVSFVLTGFIIVLGISRYNMFELVPLAQEKLLDTMNEGVLVVNANGIIEAANPALLKIFNIDEQHSIHCNYQQTFKAYPEIVKLLEKKNTNRLNLEILNANQLNYFQIKLSSITNQVGQLNGTLMVVNDVTSIRATEVKLKQKNAQLIEEIRKNEKLIDDLDAYAHTLAHDLKNSLGVIYSSSDIILEAIKDGDISQVQEFSHVVKDSAMKTIDVTNELLKMATTGHGDVDIVAVEMDRVYNNAVNHLTKTVESSKGNIRVTTKWIDALAYAPWIEEVWINLITNALKYGGNPPDVSIGCELTQNSMVKYWIKDNGDGIAKEQHQKIFRKHTRLQPDKAGGYGLGLSIVKRIVEKLGGTVGFESSGKKGAGTLFYFLLRSA